MAKNIAEGLLNKPLCFWEFAYKDEGGPEVGMGILLAQLIHCCLQRFGHVLGLDVALVERMHEFCSTLIMNVPQGKQQGSCSRAEETSL